MPLELRKLFQLGEVVDLYRMLLALSLRLTLVSLQVSAAVLALSWLLAKATPLSSEPEIILKLLKLRLVDCPKSERNSRNPLL